ncbi:MAG: choice-of-anchor Q domain-containing protein [Anaerolineales bacterium]
MRPHKPSILRYVPWCVIFLFALLVSCGGTPVPCDADILVTKTADTNDGVCSGADCSLREAVIRANICAGTQTIQLPAGTYTLTHAGAGEELAATGDLDLAGNVTILGTGKPVIDGNGADRIFDVLPGVTASLSGLVIQNGHEYNGSGIRVINATLNVNETFLQNNISTWAGDHEVDGGGIYAAGGSVLGIYLSEIRGNHAFVGGGIATEEAAGVAPTLTLSHTLVAENEAFGPGGGLWLGPGTQSTMINTEVEGNTAGNEGGGIHNNGDLELTSSTVENNHSVNAGGGILNGFVTLIARDVMLSNNEGRTGGGIYNLGMAHFYQSAIVYNTAYDESGGGVFNAGGAGLLLDNTTVGANTGNAGGGGIFNDGGNLRLMFVTVAGNSNEGIHNSGGGEKTMRNTILSGNTNANCAGTVPDSLGYNIDSADSCALVEGSDLPNTDPMLSAPAPVGTWSPAYELMAGSPAIDSADPDRCSGIDQWGVIRPQGANCDRGAVERMTTGGGDAILSGKVWHDLCAVRDGPIPATPPPGCVDTSPFVDANGILEPGEPGIPGVTLRLKSGPCATGSDLMTAVTGSEGEYSFSGLAAGTYCVSADALGDGNDLVLIPGGWSYPDGDGGVAQSEIVLADGEVRADINFGWDYQFLPAWTEPESTPTPTPAPINFGKPVVSTETLYFYGPNRASNCGPKEVTFQVGLSSGAGVANVLFFARLKEQSSGRLGAWTSGVSMTPIGNNQYVFTLLAEDIPDARTFGESWLQYQFVALDNAGGAIVRSEVFWNITLLRCEYKPG